MMMHDEECAGGCAGMGNGCRGDFVWWHVSTAAIEMV